MGQNIAIVLESNNEMTNRILERWEDVLESRDGGAIYSPSGARLRTWAGIDRESREFESRMPGETGGVALQTGNHPSFPALILACLRAGRTVSLFDADFSGEARREIEQNLGVTLRVTASSGDSLLFEETCGTGEGKSGAEICLYKLTSGTTALPRAIGFTADQLEADCDQVCSTMGIGRADTNYGVVALTHSYGFSNLVTPLLCLGVPLVVADDPLPRAIESGLRLTGATVMAAVPAIFRGLLSAASLPETLRLCISAGSLLDPQLAREFHEKFHRKIHSFYGASECGGICYDDSDWISDTHGFVGVPLRGVEIEVPDAMEGSKILIHSRAIGVGVSNPDGTFQPPDLLVRRPDGFRIVGRESDLINVAGRKVNPLEIEQVLAGFPGVQESVVCGGEDAARGEEICALVVSKAIPELLLRQHCAAGLASWKVPRRFAFVEEMPTNARGKISRRDIAQKFFHCGPRMEAQQAWGESGHDFDRIKPETIEILPAMSNFTMKQLKSKAQLLKPAIHIGKAGATPEFLTAFGEVLDRNHLVKLRFEGMKEERKTLSKQLAESTGSVLVQQVGHTAVFFRAPATGPV